MRRQNVFQPAGVAAASCWPVRAVLRLFRHLPEVRSPTHRGTLRVRRVPDLAGEHDAGQAWRASTSPTFKGTLGRKTSDCTVRPGSWANNQPVPVG